MKYDNEIKSEEEQKYNDSSEKKSKNSNDEKATHLMRLVINQII